jgi:hypothetical protein
VRVHPVQDFGDRSAVGMRADAGKGELVGSDVGNGGSVWLVVWGCEELVREDGRAFDAARHGSFVGATEPGSAA